MREKGTNRSQFFRGMVDKYTWVNLGSSFLPADTNAAYLYANLEKAHEVNNRRLEIWNEYHKAFSNTESIQGPTIPSECQHNAHMFYLKLKNIEERNQFIAHMKEHEIITPFHYIPLHSSPAGKKFGEFVGRDNYTTKESERLVRLPLFYNMTENQQDRVISSVMKFIK